jgi:hypothetical protein
MLAGVAPADRGEIGRITAAIACPAILLGGVAAGRLSGSNLPAPVRIKPNTCIEEKNPQSGKSSAPTP